MKAIHEAMREARKKRGYTLAQLEKLSGVSRSAISAAERGKTDMRLFTLLALAQALEVRLQEYIGLDEAAEPGEVAT